MYEYYLSPFPISTEIITTFWLTELNSKFRSKYCTKMKQIHLAKNRETHTHTPYQWLNLTLKQQFHQKHFEHDNVQFPHLPLYARVRYSREPRTVNSETDFKISSKSTRRIALENFFSVSRTRHHGAPMPPLNWCSWPAASARIRSKRRPAPPCNRIGFGQFHHSGARSVFNVFYASMFLNQNKTAFKSLKQTHLK